MVSRLFSGRVIAFLCALGMLVLLVTPPATHAQSTGDGSIYSRFGIGMQSDFSSPQSDALGGGGFALRSLNYNAIANPGLWSDQVYTRFVAGARYNVIDVSDGSESGRVTGGTLEALHVGIPLYARRLGVVIAFQPLSRSNYRVRNTGDLVLGVPSLNPDVDRVSTPYTVDFQGGGGLQLLRGGVGGRVTDWLRVGGAVDVVFGILENERRTRFPEANLEPVTRTDEVRLSGASGTFGSHLAFANVFQSDDNFSLGASVSLPVSLSGTRVRTIDDDDDTTPRDTVGTARSGEMELPVRARLGLAYQFDNRWTFVADGTYAPWSDFETTFDGTNGPGVFPVGGEALLDDQWSLSTGVEVVPAGNDALAGYFARTAYRLGASVERMYVQPDPAQDAYTYTGTAGLSLPTSLAGTRIDLSFRVGRRGSTDGALAQDTFYGVSLFVNFGERWFQERKLR